MNAERLHVIAKSLHEELEDNEIAEKVENLHESLESVVQNPSHPTYQKTLAESLQNVYATLQTSPSDDFSPAWQQVLEEMGGKNLLGKALKQRIEEIFQRNQITPAVALTELKKLGEDLKSFKEALSNLTSAFRQFHIGDEELKPGHCEIGMLIPREAVNNDLPSFAEELKKLSFILNTFAEVATGKAANLEIKTISSSDLTVFLEAAPKVAACLAIAIERIIALYKSLLEVKELRTKLLKSGVPESQTAGIEEHANNMMEKGLEELSVEIVQKYHPNKDDGRKNELTIALRRSLNGIADRIDRGYNVEVRCEQLAKDIPTNKESEETKANISLIQNASKNMQFMKLEGKPILRLAERSKEKGELKDEGKGLKGRAIKAKTL